MAFLFLSLLASVGIFIFFKIFHSNHIPLLKAVTINYFSCTVTGLIYNQKQILAIQAPLDIPWWPFALGLGALFLFTFFLMGKTTARVGVSLTSMATKLSLLFPAFLSIFIFHSAPLNYFVILSILIAIPAIILASMKGKTEVKMSFSFLPIGVFFLSGIIDGGINALSIYYSESESFYLFPISVFFFAATFGFILNFLKFQSLSEWIDLKLWAGGIGLGIANYFSIEFLLQGLSHFENNGALVFPFLNVGIIILSAMVGRWYFKEKLSTKNLFGLLMAILSISLLFFSII